MLWSSDVLTRTVTGNYISANGNPAQGKIYFRPTSRILDQDDAIILNTASISAVLDVNGAFSLELPVTDNPLLKPKDWAYEVIVRIYGTKETKLFLQLPYGDGSPVNLVNIMNAGSLPSTIGSSSSAQTMLRGPIGPAGAVGPVGATGATGATGPGISNVQLTLPLLDGQVLAYDAVHGVWTNKTL